MKIKGMSGKVTLPQGIIYNVREESVQNTKISNMHNLLSQGHDMDYIAKHYNMDLALAWALLLQGKTDQEKFKALVWGLRKNVSMPESYTPSKRKEYSGSPAGT